MHLQPVVRNDHSSLNACLPVPFSFCFDLSHTQKPLTLACSECVKLVLLLPHPSHSLGQVARETGMSTDSERIKIKLTVEVESVDFDAEGELP